MSDATMPTVDEIRAATLGRAALMVHWLYRSPALRHDINQRADLYRLTDWNGHSQNGGDYSQGDDHWRMLVDDLCELREECGTVEEWEREAMTWLNPLIAPRAERDLQYLVDGTDRAFWNCGSIRTLIVHRRDGDIDVILHILNAMWPLSPFADGHMRRCLLAACEAAESEGATRFRTNTWVNSLPQWQALMPPGDWKMDKPDPRVRGALDYWGQFVTHRGTLHQRRAAEFRATGRFPLATCNAGGTVAALRKHLEGLL